MSIEHDHGWVMRHTCIMLALAIVLLLVVVLLVVASFAGSSEEIIIEFLNVTITTSVGGVFVSGVVCGLIALASALAVRRSWRIRQARTEEVRELRRLAGVPDPRETEPATPAGTAHALGESGRTADADSERKPTSHAESARADVVAPSGDTNDTSSLPDTEDPPRT